MQQYGPKLLLLSPPRGRPKLHSKPKINFPIHFHVHVQQNPSLSLSSLSQNPNFRDPMALQQFGRTKSVTKRSTKYVEQALYLRLFKDGGSEVSVRQQLNEVLKSRKRVYKWEVGDTLKKLRERKLYYPALKVRNSKF